MGERESLQVKAYTEELFGVSLARCRGGRAAGAAARPLQRSPAHPLAARGIYELACTAPQINACLSAGCILRGPATSQVPLCLALLHTLGLYLRPTIYNECLRNSRGKIMIPSLPASAEEASAASSAPPPLQSRRGGPRGAAGAGGGEHRSAPRSAGGSAGAESSSWAWCPPVLSLV